MLKTLHFYDRYERFTMAWFRFFAKVPGCRKFVRWEIKKYEKNFWRAAWTSLVISTIINSSIKALGNRLNNSGTKTISRPVHPSNYRGRDPWYL